MSWVVTAVVGTAVVTSAYSADQSRKAANAQNDAILRQQAEDARKAAEAETALAVAANARLADTNRRRRGSALALGAPEGGNDTLGGAPASVLAAGGPAPAARSATAFAGTAAGTALGAGSPTMTARVPGRMTTPRPPTRGQAI